MKSYYQLSDNYQFEQNQLTCPYSNSDYNFSTREDAVVNLVTRIKNGEYIDANVIQQTLFPSVHKKIFISHSHREKDLAIKVANTLGSNICFVDSLFWGSADKALIQIQKRLLDEGKIKNTYADINKIASHFYGMLSVSIQNAIAEAEIFLYIPPSASFRNGKYSYQYSPWIYQELSCARNNYNIEKAFKKTAALMENFSQKIAYCSDLSFLKKISFRDLKTLI